MKRFSYQLVLETCANAWNECSSCQHGYFSLAVLRTLYDEGWQELLRLSACSPSLSSNHGIWLLHLDWSTPGYVWPPSPAISVPCHCPALMSLLCGSVGDSPTHCLLWPACPSFLSPSVLFCSVPSVSSPVSIWLLHSRPSHSYRSYDIDYFLGGDINARQMWGQELRWKTKNFLAAGWEEQFSPTLTPILLLP